MPPQRTVDTPLPFGAFTKEADTDYLLARMINFLGSGFYSRAGFFAQQACEKYLKALMVERTSTYLETHCLKELAALCVPYDAYFAEANTLAVLERFDMFDQIGRYGSAANFDPLSKGKTIGGTGLAIDSGLEVKGAFVWSAAWLDDLDAFVHNVRSLLDFSKAAYDDCLKSILENNACSAMVVSGGESLRRVLTRGNRFFK